MFSGKNTHIKIVDSYRVLVKSAARRSPFGDVQIGQHLTHGLHANYSMIVE